MGDNMKKILCLIVLLFVIMCTSSCVTVHKKFERVEDVANIESIEVYFIDWEEELYLQDIPESMQPIEILDKDLYEGLIQDLESFDFKSILLIFAASDPNWDIYGFVFKIIYSSGAYQVVSNCGTVYTYNSKEQSKAFHGVVSKETWNEFVKKYIGEETFEQYKLPF